MPKRKSAVKRLRADKKRRLKNTKIKNEVKKAIKKFHTLLAAKKTEEAKKFFSKVSSVLDKAAKKNILHKNTASRKKSRLSKKISKAA